LAPLLRHTLLHIIQLKRYKWINSTIEFFGGAVRFVLSKTLLNKPNKKAEDFSSASPAPGALGYLMQVAHRVAGGTKVPIKAILF